MLTYELLNAARPELVRLYNDYLPHLMNRVQYAPSLESCRVIRSEEPRYVAIIQLIIQERMNYGNLVNRHLFPQGRWIPIHYVVRPNGSTWASHPNGMPLQSLFDQDPSVPAYMEPVELWATAIHNEEASKRRIQARAQALKEELVAAVWAPARVAKRLEDGGWEAIDAFAL
jgi:hypothetical protein